MAISDLQEVQTIELGRQGENLATSLQFNLQEFYHSYGAGNAVLIHKRPGDTRPYIAAEASNSYTITWNLEDEDTAQAGVGQAEIRYYVGSVLKKSAVFSTYVVASIMDDMVERPGNVVYMTTLGASMAAKVSSLEAMSPMVIDTITNTSGIYAGIDDITKQYSGKKDYKYQFVATSITCSTTPSLTMQLMNGTASAGSVTINAANSTFEVTATSDFDRFVITPNVDITAITFKLIEVSPAVTEMASVAQLKQNIQDISTAGTNLYNGDDVEKTTTTAVYTEVTLANPLPAGTYTLSSVVKSTSTAHDVVKCNLRIRGDSSELAQAQIGVGYPNRTSTTFTITDTAKSIRFYGSTGTGADYKVDTSEFRNIQIESGSTASDYVAFKLTACDEIARTMHCTETYYVSATGSDDNKGTAAEPFATIGKAIEIGAKVIVLAKGTYTENYRTTVQKNVKIIGNGSTIKYSNGSTACLEFRLSSVEIENLIFDATEATGSISGLFLRDCTAKIVNCKVVGSPYMGFRLDGSKVTLERCEATGCSIDGFNAHDTANNVSDGTFIDCVSHDNNDDGLSYHENGCIHVHGGKYYDNASTGIAPHNGCNCEIIGAYIYGNGSGIEAFNTNSTVSPYPTIVCSGCVITGNTSDETARGYGISAKYYNGVVNSCAIADNQKGTVVQDANSNIVVY